MLGWRTVLAGAIVLTVTVFTPGNSNSESEDRAKTVNRTQIGSWELLHEEFDRSSRRRLQETCIMATRDLNLGNALLFTVRWWDTNAYLDLMETLDNAARKAEWQEERFYTIGSVVLGAWSSRMFDIAFRLTDEGTSFKNVVQFATGSVLWDGRVPSVRKDFRLLRTDDSSDEHAMVLGPEGWVSSLTEARRLAVEFELVRGVDVVRHVSEFDVSNFVKARNACEDFLSTSPDNP